MDPAALVPLRAIDARRPGFLSRIVAVFLEEAAARIEEMREATGAGDRARVNRAAHTLKSSAATLGATRLSALCGDLQDATRADGAAVPAGRVEPIAAELARVEEALSGIVAGETSTHGSR